MARYFIDTSDPKALSELVRKLAASRSDRRKLICTVCDEDGRELLQLRLEFGETDATHLTSLRPTKH
jgi:hypothetical protein